MGVDAAMAASPQAVHSGGKLGDKREAVSRAFVDKGVVALGRCIYIRLARRGRCEPPEPHRGVILGAVSGTRFGGRKASGRGSRAAPGDSGLVRSRREADWPVSYQFLRAFSCAGRRRGTESGGARKPRRADAAARGSRGVALQVTRFERTCVGADRFGRFGTGPSQVHVARVTARSARHPRRGRLAL